MYVHVINDVLISANWSKTSIRQHFKTATPSRSIARDITDTELEDLDFYKMKEVEQPTGDVITEGVQKLIEGVWTQTWVTRAFNAEETAVNLASLQQGIVDQAQSRLDTAAREHGYDSIISVCSYATSTVTRYRAEGIYCVGLRDSTWSKMEEILAAVKAGSRPVPSGYQDIEGDLPEIMWPV